MASVVLYARTTQTNFGPENRFESSAFDQYYDLSTSAGSSVSYGYVTFVAGSIGMDWTVTEGGASIWFVSKRIANQTRVCMDHCGLWARESNNNDNAQIAVRFMYWSRNFMEGQVKWQLAYAELSTSVIERVITIGEGAGQEIDIYPGDRIGFGVTAADYPYLSGSMTAGTGTFAFNGSTEQTHAEFRPATGYDDIVWMDDNDTSASWKVHTPGGWRRAKSIQIHTPGGWKYCPQTQLYSMGTWKL
jgi:hypothetical protein